MLSRNVPERSRRSLRNMRYELVRDQIPGIITAAGRQPVTRVLDQAGYQAALRTKLLEEAREAQAAPDGRLASELADVLEVLKALAAAGLRRWAREGYRGKQQVVR